MSEIELQLLGEFQVLRDGQPQPLPPSRKTRALLAYLSLNPRPFRREQLCELLWEVPDDPRGSLRWSLSKLRRLVDTSDRKRIVADRNCVRFDADGLCIDAVELFELAERGLSTAPLETLEGAAGRLHGTLLEGTELSGFHDFHAWCVAERERAAGAQSAVLDELTRRLADEPVRALPYARALVTVSPYDESYRARLIRLLLRLNHSDEAEQHYRLGQRMLAEIGIHARGQLYDAWRSAPTRQAASPAPREPAAPADDRTASAASLDLLGRDTERARLSGALDRVRSENRARLMLLRGEPGIGKTALLGAVRERAAAADALVLASAAYESESFRPFALWVDALRGLGGDAEAAIFGDLDLDHRDRLLGRLSALVDREAGQRPVVIVFDDYQWSDESSATALHYVVRMNRERPLLGVIAARAGELRDNVPARQAIRDLRHDGLLEELTLGPLPEATIRQLIEERAPGADPERLSRECGGNPLLAIELARAGRTDGGSLDELVRGRLARFDAEGAEVLRWAALLSPQIRLDALVQLTTLEAARVGSALETAARDGLLAHAGEPIRFSHDLIARSVYNDISPLRRQVMHRNVAALLERDSAMDLDYAAALAHHALSSGDAALGARALVQAGRLCLRFFANDEALSHARKGLQLADQLSGADRVCVSIDLHGVALAAAAVEDWEAASEHYVQLAEQALDLGQMEHARLGYHLASTLRWEHGHWSSAREQTLQAARVARGGDDAHNIIGLAETAKCLALLERDLSQADAMLMEAQALAARRQFRHHAIPLGLGLLRLYEDRLDEAEELLLEARTLCKSEGDRISEFLAAEHLAMIAWYRGDFVQAGARCRALQELGGKLREGSEEPMSRALQGLCIYHEQDEVAALERALEDLRVADAKHRLAYTQSRAALVDLERSRFTSARDRAAEALSCAEVLQRPTETLIAHTALYRACRALGDAAAADEHRRAMTSDAAGSASAWARAQAAAALQESVAEPA